MASVRRDLAGAVEKTKSDMVGIIEHVHMPVDDLRILKAALSVLSRLATRLEQDAMLDEEHEI